MAEITGFDLLKAVAVACHYTTFQKQFTKKGDWSAYQSSTVGAKVYSTHITSHGIEECRIACGGHGYSAYSVFGRMYANTVKAMTYEGDNYVLSQQLPPAILKHFDAPIDASVPSLSYL
ncbi:acyl-CoA dehydrogenase/oxidase C-terminal [Clohesyomyces aquaticus]|uniref:Acyl-CoA dehydrogenase/oxidase C-terminal n=1 Tax=Clohesyomyces aquaticus TaxID=1231657 RepID=A0A1Y1Y0U4_9PLEO|nr:acyl-CoA dehydrogenase/oxidase C-terminal [Clohesyomyces aquaticus]